MIGSLNNDSREVTVIGAGIAGMLAAYALDQRGYTVTLLEEKARAGGLLRTRNTHYGIAEAAANSLLASAAVTDLCGELGVELVPVRKEARSRFILRDGKLRKFPLTIAETLGTLRHAAFAPATNHTETVDLAAWGQRHLGPAAVEYLLTPFVRGIYGVQPKEVGVAAALPGLIVPVGRTLFSNLLTKSLRRSGKKQKHGGMVAPKKGMGELVTKLENQLERRLGSRFRRGVRRTELPDAPNIIIATPAYRAAELIELDVPVLATQLREVEYTPLVSVTAFVERSAMAHEVNGVGVLIPAVEKRSCLGILFSSSAFPGRVTNEAKYASFTLMMGGSADRGCVHADDETIKAAVQQELSEILGLRGEPLETIIHRWPRAIPQYSIALPKLWQVARATWCASKGRILFGNYTGQVSMRGMIESASKLPGVIEG